MATQNLSSLYPLSPLTVKGDIYVFGPGPTRLPVGADGYILGANSAEATGLEWVLNPGTPPGSDQQVIFNDGGAYGADAGMTYNKTTDVLTVSNAIQTTEIGIDTVDTSSIFFSAGAGDPLMSLSVDGEVLAQLESVSGSLSTIFNYNRGGDVVIRNTASGDAFKYDNTADIITGSFIRAENSNTVLGKLAAGGLTGTETTAVGRGAGYSLAAATGNTLFGYLAGQLITTSPFNVCIGPRAGFNVSVQAGLGGGRNTLIGPGAGYGITDGESNTIIGPNSQTVNNVTNCVIIGSYAGHANSADNKLIISSQLSTIPTLATPIIDGTFAATPSAQSLSLNANVILTENLTFKGNTFTQNVATGTANNDTLVTKGYVDDLTYQYDLGWFTTGTALNTAYPSGQPEASNGYWATVGATDTIWVYDADTDAFVDSGGGGSTTLAGLSDTTIVSPASGQILVYSSSWQNQSNLPVGAMPVSGTWNLTAPLTIDGAAVTVDDGLSVNTGLTLFGGTQVTALSTGTGDNDKLVTQGYVDDAVSAAGFPTGDVVNTTSASFTVLTSHYCIIANASLNAITVTLPAPTLTAGQAGTKGRMYVIKWIDGTYGCSVVSASGNIDNASSYDFATVNDSITVISDGSNWWVI